MRRPTTIALATCALALAACGDNEENTGGGGSDPSTSAETTTPATTVRGCRPAEEPRPKPDETDREKPDMTVERGDELRAVVKTSCGTLTIRLATNRAPKTVNNFVALARDGFYDDLPFHRIVPGFVAQGGDPLGTGNGGPGYNVREAPPEDLRYTRGTVAMAKTQLEPPGTSGSQFFIVTDTDGPAAQLTPDYALLGRVEDGLDTLDRLADVPNDPADNRPTEPVVIEDVTIEEG